MVNPPKTRSCPHCGNVIEIYHQPKLTVDMVVFSSKGEVCLIERKNPPFGYALPGGFVDYGETLEAAAERESEEETGLIVKCLKLVGVYSNPERDPRHHTVTAAYLAKSDEPLRAGDDAKSAFWADPLSLPKPLLFDHATIIADALTTFRECRIVN